MGSLMKRVLALFSSLIMASGLFASTASAGFPEKEVIIVVGFAAGGLADQGAPIWAKTASQFLGQPVVILNRPGSGGVIATNELANER
jgi:tripartite-type tricarboxylate transporter receptor subunit TctC